MKKSLFLAVATLLCVGAAKSQDVTLATGGIYPAAKAVTTNSLVATGTQSTTIGNNATNAIKMTVGAAYDFQATTTDWTASTALGTSWNSYISGSNITFNNANGSSTADATFALLTAGTGTVTSTSAVSNMITTGTASTFGVSIQATSALSQFDFFETAYDKQTTPAAVSCGNAYTIYVNTVNAPSWKDISKTPSGIGGNANLTINKNAFCINDISSVGKITITANLAANTEVSTRYFKTTLSNITGTEAPVFSDKVLTAVSKSTEDYQLDLFKLMTDNVSLGSLSAGVYKFYVTGVSDEILSNAEATAVATVADTNVSDDYVTFTLLPTTKPTLTTGTNK
jgi:hypothetical protein